MLFNVYDRCDRWWPLFDLLKEREDTVNISHRKMPSWDEHVDFVESRPYVAWYFIGKEPFGACYLTHQNEIGVFVFKAHQGQGHARKAVEALMEKHGDLRYLANINPHNYRSIAFFTALGFNCCQETYERLPSRS